MEVATAIRTVAGGQTTLASDAGVRLIESLVRPGTGSAIRDGAAITDTDAKCAVPASLRARFTDLTAREAEVLTLISQGHGNTEIATELFIGVTTVRSHINTLFAKLDVKDRGKAMELARG